MRVFHFYYLLRKTTKNLYRGRKQSLIIDKSPSLDLGCSKRQNTAETLVLMFSIKQIISVISHNSPLTSH